MDASLWSSWAIWVDWDHLSVVVPLVVVESVPVSIDILVSEATMMPVASEPSPSSTIATSGWSPVVPFSAFPSVPDAPVELPVGRWLNRLRAPLADDVVSLVSLNPFAAHLLGGEDLLVLGSNLSVVLVAGFVELNH